MEALREDSDWRLCAEEDEAEEDEDDAEEPFGAEIAFDVMLACII